MQTYEITKLYNGTVELKFNPLKHHYTYNNETVDGITSVLQIISKPALINWAANKAGEYIEENLPVGKIIDEIEKRKLINGCKTAHRTFKNNAADVGKMFHLWCSDHIKNKKPPMPTNEMLRKAVEQFLLWIKEKEVVFEHSERQVFSKKHQYAGTFDFTAIIQNKRVLGDFKTSTGIYSEHWLQAAAYKLALQEEIPEQIINHTVIVRCGKDGSFEVQEMNDFEENAQAFLSALYLFRRIKKMKFYNTF